MVVGTNTMREEMTDAKARDSTVTACSLLYWNMKAFTTSEVYRMVKFIVIRCGRGVALAAG